MVNIMKHGNRVDVGMRVREESCLIFSSGDGRLAILFVEISNSGKEVGIGRNNNEISHVMVKTVKNLPSLQETCVQSLGWEDPLEEGMATHSSILTWRIPWTEDPGGLQFRGLQRVRHTERLSLLDFFTLKVKMP